MAKKGKDLLFDRYSLGRVLGEGYFGLVYLARDNVLGRDIAIKALKREFVKDAEVLRRFANDARIAAAVGHPNIVVVYDLLPAEGPRYIMMEYLPNGTLQTLLERRGKMPVAEAVDVGLSIARALKTVHGKGVVHRDIKPSNILLGDDGLIKLADFGIAHLPKSYGGMGVTRLGQPHPCTPTYASPEQVCGSPLDGRSDLYTVGVLLYQLVTGSFYFDLNRYPDAADCFSAVLHHQPVSPRNLNEEIPALLDQIIMRLLQKSPDSRYQDAVALVRDLERLFPSSPHDLHGTIIPKIITVNTTAQREGGAIRHRIRVEARNDGDKAALWSGLTVNLPVISTREEVESCELSVWSSRKGDIARRAPGDSFYGFRGDGTFGEMPATCLFVETPSSAWTPGEYLSLEVSFVTTKPECEAHVRAWASWETNGETKTKGDPEWSRECLRDQQRIPAYKASISLPPEC